MKEYSIGDVLYYKGVKTIVLIIDKIPYMTFNEIPFTFTPFAFLPKHHYKCYVLRTTENWHYKFGSVIEDDGLQVNNFFDM